MTKQFITVHPPGKAALRFVVSDTLAAGKTPSEPRHDPLAPYEPWFPYKYRLADVHVGDHVTVMYAVVNGVEICDHICIQKRPGGRVPPLPDDARDPDRLRYHERMNAYWDLEERGIPYPAHFGLQRRFPIAPPPREVKK